MGSSVSVPTNTKKTYPSVPNISVNNTNKNNNNHSTIPQPYRAKESEKMTFNGNFEYRSRILKLKTPNGKLDKIRKIASKSNNFIYEETKHEIEIYKILSKKPDSEKYILPFEASGESEESVYLNLKYVEGDDIYSFFKKPKRQIKAAQYLLSGVKALYWLFKNGYIHGDVKLDNLFFLPDGSTRLLDFGRVKNISTIPKEDAIEDAMYEVNNIVNICLKENQNYVEGHTKKYDKYIPIIEFIDTRKFNVNRKELRSSGNITLFLDTFFKDFIAFIEQKIKEEERRLTEETKETKGGKRTKSKTKTKRNKANTKKKNK